MHVRRLEDRSKFQNLERANAKSTGLFWHKREPNSFQGNAWYILFVSQAI